MKLTDSKTGFTLVEIIIVMALGGLIAALVFYALPLAQQSRRDASRKAYLQQVSSNLEKYHESLANNFQYPQTANFASAFQSGGSYHVLNQDKDPLSNSLYSFIVPPSTLTKPSSSNPAQILYNYPSPPCTNLAGSPSVGIWTLQMELEDGNTFCLDNH